MGNYYRNTPVTTLTLWLLVNLFIPMFLPAIVLYAYSISQGIGDGFWRIFMKLINCGMYLFSSFSLTFSLFEDYHTACQVIKPHHYLMIAICLIFIVFMFIACNPVLTFSNTIPFSNITPFFLIIFLGLVALNSYLKLRILSTMQHRF